jgi:FSR family fosmidomycin resistance protein-like MFS transporter
MDRTTDRPADAGTTVMRILLALSFSHLLNDTIQALLPAIYPLLKAEFGLSFTQIGLITFCFQLTGSILQPAVGYYTDRRPMPNSLAIGMGFSLVGLVLLAFAQTYSWVLVSACLVGMGSAVFHPEASRVARMASGGRHGFAQSLFQVGGNFGSSLGPLLAALIMVKTGHTQILWFTLLALLAIVVLARVGAWYRAHAVRLGSTLARPAGTPLLRARVVVSVAILLALIFSKYFYLVSLTSYYTFYLIAKFHLAVRSAQLALFLFQFSVAAGTILGGPVGDRFGRKYVIWVSILGVAPFTLILPHVGLGWTLALSVVIGLVLASAFSAILVFAQDLIPGRTGLVSGLFFGFAFGVAGVGSAALGWLADHTSISYVFQVCAYLPLIGLLTGFLPNLEGSRKPPAAAR